MSWQSIIYDLINTEQLDPWDVNRTVLTNKYLEKIKDLEEANLFISSKVLFAASLLLRIKTEILLNHYLPSLDEILFGRADKKKYIQERIELEDEVPGLVPRTPLPRHRKVTLQELMAALGKAVKTENRRIEKVVQDKQREIETAIALPKGHINIGDKIKEIYAKLKGIFSIHHERYAFSSLVNEHNGGDKVSTFVPLLHLDNQHKILLEQEGHFEEIWIWLKEHYMSRYADDLEKMRREAELASVQDELEREQEESDQEDRSFDRPSVVDRESDKGKGEEE